MKIAIMQPYFLPYIGYYQMIKIVDKFVVYDNIEFTKKGWIHRNRMLQNGKDVYFTLPLKRDSDYLDINERSISDSFKTEKNKMLNRVKSNYQKAPYFKNFYPIVEDIFNYNNTNLFKFIFNSIKQINSFLNIDTEILVSSTLGEDLRQLKSTVKVIEINKRLKSTQYINAIGGRELYSREIFSSHNIKLQFIQSKPVEYKQFNNDFVPWLSILDVLMFNSAEEVNHMLSNYELL
ncbi:MAG: WbqC family protein [Sedimentibacter sp.]